MAIVIDESVIALITTVCTVILGVFSKYAHSKYVSASNSLDIASKKAELGAELIKSIKEANDDAQITPQEFTGIVNNINKLIDK